MDIPDSYLDTLRERGKKKSARTRVAELILAVEPHIAWETATVIRDRRAVYAMAHQYARRKTWAELERIMQWVKQKGTVHPRAVVALLVR